MRKKQRFSFKDRINSFRHAFNGIRLLLLEEHNSRIHLLAATLAISLAFYLGISAIECLALLIVIALVLICEIFNTALENLCDFIEPEKHPAIKKIKDLSAAAVLLSALLSLVVGGIIFIPKLIL